jgi:hypothetical protein
MLFPRCFFRDAFSYSLSHLGKLRPFTECLNTMTTN